ncbi:hypothetical protein C9374_003206 [Naegleria lovaniensis]|uniref:Uncharacterized protein n=1 Tax=Naegleria lovaniensis TaxID=51637 RepID=A0AA88GS78_NAELO|nr:uncharacterized protein C9374_003206 [Naegleria lovaniensis]KAG2386057.1 hypothetical protein C9374_003206 [Naegleria lovaniensis]
MSFVWRNVVKPPTTANPGSSVINHNTSGASSSSGGTSPATFSPTMMTNNGSARNLSTTTTTANIPSNTITTKTASSSTKTTGGSTTAGSSSTTAKRGPKKKEPETSTPFFATSFIPLHSASLKGITPLMSSKPVSQQPFIAMSNASLNSMPPFPTSSKQAYDSEDDMLSYSSNSSDSDSGSSSGDSESSNDDSYESSSSTSSEKLKKKKKPKKKTLKKETSTTKKKTNSMVPPPPPPAAAMTEKPSEKKEGKKIDEKPEKKRKTKKKEKDSTQPVELSTKTDEKVAEKSKKVADIKPTSTTPLSTTTTNTATTPSATATTTTATSTPKPKRKYTRKKDKEAAAATKDQDGTNVEKEPSPAKKKRKAKSKSAEGDSTTTTPKKKKTKTAAVVTPPVTSTASTTPMKEATSSASLATILPKSTLEKKQKDTNIYATEDDERLFIMDRYEFQASKSLKKIEDPPFFSKNYSHDKLRDDIYGLPWCFVKESEINGADKSNNFMPNSYLEHVVNEHHNIFSEDAVDNDMDDDIEMKTAKQENDPIYEPVSISGYDCLIPIELIQNPQLFKTIFSMHTWNNVLKEHHRMYLKQFLPPCLFTNTTNHTMIDRMSSSLKNETITDNSLNPETSTLSNEKDHTEKKHFDISESREEELREWQQLMNGSSVRHKKSTISSSGQTNSPSPLVKNSVTPKPSEPEILTRTLSQLFNQTSLLFNQPNYTTKLIQGITRGEYHPSVQLEKQQLSYLRSINLRMEYHLYVECELMAKRKLSAQLKIKNLNLTIPAILMKPTKKTILAIEDQKRKMAERNNNIPIPQVPSSLMLDQQGGSMEPPSSSNASTVVNASQQQQSTTSQIEPVASSTPSKETDSKSTKSSQAPSTLTPVKERKKPGPKPKKKKEGEPVVFEFVSFKVSGNPPPEEKEVISKSKRKSNK